MSKLRVGDRVLVVHDLNAIGCGEYTERMTIWESKWLTVSSITPDNHFYVRENIHTWIEQNVVMDRVISINKSISSYAVGNKRLPEI